MNGTLFNCKLAKLVVGRLLTLLMRNREEVAIPLDDDQTDCTETDPEEVGEEPRFRSSDAVAFVPPDEGAKNCEPVV